MRISRLHRILLARRVILLGLLVSGRVTIAFVRTAAASPCNANEQWMYSEPEHINQVGTRWVNCDVPWIVQEGTMTQYVVVQWSWSCGNEECP